MPELHFTFGKDVKLEQPTKQIIQKIAETPKNIELSDLPDFLQDSIKYQVNRILERKPQSDASDVSNGYAYIPQEVETALIDNGAVVSTAINDKYSVFKPDTWQNNYWHKDIDKLCRVLDAVGVEPQILDFDAIAQSANPSTITALRTSPFFDKTPEVRNLARLNQSIGNMLRAVSALKEGIKHDTEPSADEVYFGLILLEEELLQAKQSRLPIEIELQLEGIKTAKPFWIIEPARKINNVLQFQPDAKRVALDNFEQKIAPRLYSEVANYLENLILQAQQTKCNLPDKKLFLPYIAKVIDGVDQANFFHGYNSSNGTRVLALLKSKFGINATDLVINK